MNQTTVNLIEQWLDKVATLEAAKQQELQLRNQLVTALFPRHKEEGSENYYLPNPDYKISGQFSLNYKLDQDEVETVLHQLRAMGEDGPWIADNLFKHKFEIVPRLYNLLPPQYKAVVDRILTIKPSTPQVKFVAPKEQAKETLL